jgi:hypothetical protein
MSYYEDITRMRVNQAIQDGLISQGAARGLGKQRPSPWKTTMVVITLVVLLAIPVVFAGM